MMTMLKKFQILIAVLAFVNFKFGFCRKPHGQICPEVVKAGWLHSPPYIYNEKGVENINNVTGALIGVLKNGLQQCCRNKISINFVTRYDDINMLVDEALNSTLDLLLPVRTNVGKTIFLTSPYVALVESPGSVFFNLQHRSTDRAIIKILISCLPLASLLILWVFVFGVLFWIVDIIPRKAGKDRTMPELCGEIFESIWWAFVTLATVGYGDIIPTRTAGRLLCYIWLICSSVSIAYFSATVTSLLITECFNSELSVEGSKVAVLNGAREHAFVIQKNGLPKAFKDMASLLSALHNDKELDGVMIDLYTASYYTNQLQLYRIQKVFEDVSSYGVVLREHTISIQKCLVQHVLNTQREIYASIREKFPPLKTNITLSASEETSQNLLAPSTGRMENGFIGICVALLLFSIIGVITEKIILHKKKKHKKDDFESFVLLQRIKTSHRAEIETAVTDLKEDLSKLQEQISDSLKYLERFDRSKSFRANVVRRKSNTDFT